MMDIKQEDLRVRTLTPNDLPILLKWLTDDRVLEFYGGRDQKFTEVDIIREYYEEDKEIATRFIVEYNDIPIGYVQVYDMIDDYYTSYHYDEKGEIVFSDSSVCCLYSLSVFWLRWQGGSIQPSCRENSC